MTMPLGRHPDGTWLAADIAERDVIGLREAARVNDRCVIPGTDAIFRCTAVGGLDASTWVSGDWTMDSLIIEGNLFQDAASPLNTLGDGTGSPVFNLQKTAAGTIEQRFRVGTSDSANDKRVLLDASELWMFQSHNGASWDTGYFLDNNADFNVPGQLLLAGALAANAPAGSNNIIIGDGSGSPGAYLFGSAGANFATLGFGRVSGSNRGFIRYSFNADVIGFGVSTNEELLIGTTNIRPNADAGLDLGATNKGFGSLYIKDGITAPGTPSTAAVLYVDSADGSLKVKFSDGFVSVIAVDS